MIKKAIDELYSLPDIVQDSNAGGILEDIRVCPAEWIEKIDVPSNSSVLGADAIVLKTGAYWIMLRAAYNSAEWSCTPEETEHGTVWSISLPFEMPKTRPSVTEWLRRYGGMPIVAIGVDRNGYGRLLGTKSEKMRMKFGMGVGKRKSKNATGVEIYGAMSVPGLFVDSLDETVAYISATADAVFYNENAVLQELDGILERLLEIETKQAWVNDSMFRLYVVDDVIDEIENNLNQISSLPYPGESDGSGGVVIAPPEPVIKFNLPDNICNVPELNKVDFGDREIHVLGAYLQGQYLKTKLSTVFINYSEWQLDYDCLVLYLNGGSYAYFSPERVTLNSENNTFQLLVRVKA